MIIVAFDFRTKCAVTDRIETAYIVDDLQLLLFEPNVTCMQGLEIHGSVSEKMSLRYIWVSFRENEPSLYIYIKVIKIIHV